MPFHAAMMFERHGRRERMQSFGLYQDLRTQRRVRLDHPPLGLVECARLPHDVERNLCLADVVQQRRFDERRQRRFVQPDLLAEQQAEHRHVHRVTVGQVLVLLDGQDLTQSAALLRATL